MQVIFIKKGIYFAREHKSRENVVPVAPVIFEVPANAKSKGLKLEVLLACDIINISGTT